MNIVCKRIVVMLGLLVYIGSAISMVPLNNGADARRKMKNAPDVMTAARILVDGFNQFFYNGGTDEREITQALKEFKTRWGISLLAYLRDTQDKELAKLRNGLEKQIREAQAHLEGLEVEQEQAIAREEAAQRRIAAYEEASRKQAEQASSSTPDAQARLLEQQKNLDALKNLLETEQPMNKDAHQEAEDRLADLLRENEALRKSLEDCDILKGQIELLQAQINALTTNNKILLMGQDAAAKQHAQKLAALKKQLQDCQDEKENLQRALDAAQKARQDYEADKARKSSPSEQTLTDRITALEAENDALRQQLAHCKELEESNKALEDQVEQLQAAMEKAVLDKQGLNQQAASLKPQLDQANKDKAQLQKLYDQARTQNAKLGDLLKQTGKDHAELERLRQENKSSTELQNKLNQCTIDLVLNQQGYDLLKCQTENNALLTDAFAAGNFVIAHKEVWPILTQVSQRYKATGQDFINEINRVRRIILDFAAFVKEQRTTDKSDQALELQRNYFADKKITWDEFVQQFQALKKAK